MESMTRRAAAVATLCIALACILVPCMCYAQPVPSAGEPSGGSSTDVTVVQVDENIREEVDIDDGGKDAPEDGDEGSDNANGTRPGTPSSGEASDARVATTAAPKGTLSQTGDSPAMLSIVIVVACLMMSVGVLLVSRSQRYERG